MAWYGGYGGFGGWRPYVPVAQRRAQANSYAAKIAKKEKRSLAPVKIEGKKIARSFWGEAWCGHLECYSDFANRLPRGRTYVRNGSVVDLQIERGKIKALVAGSEVYTVEVAIKTLEKGAWKRIKRDCSQSIDSVIDLLQGRFEKGIMERLIHRETGLFPKPAEIDMECSCPDWAGLCKHVAAVLYGVGARLDTAPELLFKLRAVDHLELIAQAVAADNLDRTLASGQSGALQDSNLGELFGIDIDAGGPAHNADANARRPPDSGAPSKTSSRKRGAAPAVRVNVPVARPAKGAAQRIAATRKKAMRKKAAAKKGSNKRRTAKPVAVAASRNKTS
jgi:uncharacterized Zn finger protein